MVAIFELDAFACVQISRKGLMKAYCDSFYEAFLALDTLLVGSIIFHAIGSNKDENTILRVPEMNPDRRDTAIEPVSCPGVCFRTLQSKILRA